jgi:hypothetical protein
MQFLRVLVTVFALFASMLIGSGTATAVTGFDSSYAGESAFVTLAPGQHNQFQVFFVNTGSTTWVKGTGTQVDLAACLEDKTTCNAQDPREATWNTGWLSTTRYSAQVQGSVPPRSVGTFTYTVTAPSNAAAGTYRFNGDLVLASTGAGIHPEGYYQEATVPAAPTPTPSPTPGSTAFPSPTPVQPTPTPTPVPTASPTPTPTPTPTQAPPTMLCFDGTTDTLNGDTGGAIYGGVCTKTGARSATLNNIPAGRDGTYSGVYFDPDVMKGDALSTITSLGFSYTGSSTEQIGLRFSIPVDADLSEDALDGAFDLWIYVDADKCNDGAGTVDVIHDATCTIDTSAGITEPNWATLLADHPNWRVADQTSFLIADQPGAWTISNVHIGN